MGLHSFRDIAKRLKEHLFILDGEGIIIFEDSDVLKYYGLASCLGKKLEEIIDVIPSSLGDEFGATFKTSQNFEVHRFYSRKVEGQSIELIYCDLFANDPDYYFLNRDSLNLLLSGLKDLDYQFSVADKEGVLYFTNKMFHNTPEQVIGRKILEITPPQHQDEIEEKFNQLITEGTSYTARSKLPTSNPNYFSEYYTSVRPIVDDGKVNGAIFLTKELNGERILISPAHTDMSEEMIENSSDIFYALNREGKLEHVNTLGLKKLGYNYEELVGKHFNEFVKPSYQEQVARFYQEQLDNRLWSTYHEFPLMTKDGNELWLGQHVQITRDKENRILGTQVVARDITTNKETEKQLKESELRNKRIVQSLPDLFMRIDKKGIIRDVELNGHDFFGIKNNVQYKKLKELPLKKTQLLKLEEVLNKAISEKEVQVVDFTAKNKKQYEARLVNVSRGEVIMSIRDIHSRKLYEKEILEAKQKAEKSSKAKEEFISVLSHELRNPLNAVIGLINLMMDDNEIDSHKENIKAIKYSSDNLLSIITEILDFSKIEAGKVDIENTDFNLDILLQGISHIVKSKKDEDVKFEIIKSPDVPKYLFGDQLKLNQILLNLLINSAKFTHDGDIQLFISLVDNSSEGLQLQFKVKDTGIGISKDKIKEVFQSYNQGKTEIARKYGGSGLGLSITKELIHLLGGGNKPTQ